MSVAIVSTFSQQNYNEYAKYFVDSLITYLDRNVQVFLYLDDIKLKLPSNIHTINFSKTVPNIGAFRERNKHRTFKDFSTDACRFSFKSYAWCHAGLAKPADKLIWLDADTELYNPVSEAYLESTLPAGHYTSHLWRPTYGYTETGYLGWDLTHPHSDEFFNRYQNYYDTDSIYTLPAYTDCHVYDAVRSQMESEGTIKSYNLSPPDAKKDHFTIAFKNYIMHYKGDRITRRSKTLSKLKGTKV